MEDPNPDNWLPQGWTVEVTMKTNGKRDKFYVCPSNGLKFNSKLEVLHYLHNARDEDGIQKTSSNSETVTMKPTVLVSVDQTSHLDMIGNDQQIPRPASYGEHMPVAISGCIPNQGVIGTQLTGSILSGAESSDQKEAKVGLGQEGALVSSCTKEDGQEKQVQENSGTGYETEKAQAQKRKYKRKEFNLPRRASKRLAGIKVDESLELPKKRRGCRVAVKQSSGEEAIKHANKFPSSLPDAQATQFSALEGGSEIRCTSKNHIEKTLEVHGTDKDKECSSFTPLENCATVKEECVGVINNGDKHDAMPDYAPEFPLTELLTDPCIAFAVQTLTGETYDISNTNTSQTSEFKTGHLSETSDAAFPPAEGHDMINNDISGNIVLPSPENFTVSKEHADDKASNENAGASFVIPSPQNFAVPQEHAGVAQIDDKADNEDGGASFVFPSLENIAGPLELAASDPITDEKALNARAWMDPWMDPCMEFAIQTLTGTMPMDSDQNPKNCTQPQLSSSSTQHIDLPSFSLDNLFQNDYFYNQYFGTQDPVFNQSFVDPNPSLQQHTSNIGTGNSSGTRLPDSGEDNRKNSF